MQIGSNTHDKLCIKTPDFHSGCLSNTYTFSSENQTISCTRYDYTDGQRSDTAKDSKKVTLVSTCGPLQLDIPHKTYIHTGKVISQQCPVPAGTSSHFQYRWYIGSVSGTPIVSERLLYGAVGRLPQTYICVIKNIFTQRLVRYTLTVRQTQQENDQERSLLWVVIPAALIIVLVPLAYLAYLKFIGEFDLKCCCHGHMLEDDVDYVITQVAESSTRQTDIKRKKSIPKPMSAFAILKRTLRQMSSAIHKVGSNISLSATVEISLPLTNDPTKIKASKKIRNKRADILKSLNISTLFKRPYRKIQKQTDKVYDDDETNWVASGIRKVDRWLLTCRGVATTSHSVGSIEDIIEQDVGLENWKTKIIVNQDRVHRSDVPCNKELWLEKHRLDHDDKIVVFQDSDINELSDKLNEMYRIIKPKKEYFPSVKTIKDPFESVLSDENREHHDTLVKMWDDYMEQLFVVSTCVSSFHKLCRKVLERTLAMYGNPEKKKRKSSQDKQTPERKASKESEDKKSKDKNSNLNGSKGEED